MLPSGRLSRAARVAYRQNSAQADVAGGRQYCLVYSLRGQRQSTLRVAGGQPVGGRGHCLHVAATDGIEIRR